jgi:hypothetical protein
VPDADARGVPVSSAVKRADLVVRGGETWHLRGDGRPLCGATSTRPWPRLADTELPGDWDRRRDQVCRRCIRSLDASSR